MKNLRYTNCVPLSSSVPSWEPTTTEKKRKKERKLLKNQREKESKREVMQISRVVSDVPVVLPSIGGYNSKHFHCFPDFKSSFFLTIPRVSFHYFFFLTDFEICKFSISGKYRGLESIKTQFWHSLKIFGFHIYVSHVREWYMLMQLIYLIFKFLNFLAGRYAYFCFCNFLFFFSLKRKNFYFSIFF